MELRLLNRQIHIPLNGLHVSRQIEYSILLRYLDLRGSERVLDVACGDGYWSAKLARSAGEVVGFDFNHKRLKQAQRLHDFLGLVRSDAHELPFKREAFDAAIGICVLEHFKDDFQAVSELRRVLKPGGKLALTVDSFSLPNISPAEKERHARKYSVVHWYRTDNIRDLLNRCGFELVESTYLLRSPLAAAFYKQTLSSRRISYLLYPVSYPLSVISERWYPANDAGYKLAVKAIAR